MLELAMSFEFNTTSLVLPLAHADRSSRYVVEAELYSLNGSFLGHAASKFDIKFIAPSAAWSEFVGDGVRVVDEAWVINLDSRPDRWENAGSELGKLNITPMRWNATHISLMSESEIAESVASQEHVWKLKVGALDAGAFSPSKHFAFTRSDPTGSDVLSVTEKFWSMWLGVACPE